MFQRKRKPSPAPSRAERRRADRHAQKNPSSRGIDMVLPDPGPATFGSGWALPWRVFIDNCRRPFAHLPLLFATLAIFTLTKMTAIYLFGVVWWGMNTRDPQVEQFMNMGLWQMGSWFMGPAMLIPWFGSALMFSSGFRARWKIVAETVASRERVFALMFLGTVALVAAGAFGAFGASLVDRFGLMPILGTGLLALWFMEVSLMTASAGVWQEGWSGRRALLEAVLGWRRSWKSIVGITISMIVLAILVLGVLAATLLAPVLVLDLPSQQSRWMGFFALPILLVLWGWWWNAKARFALAFLEWGAPPEDNSKPESPAAL